MNPDPTEWRISRSSLQPSDQAGPAVTSCLVAVVGFDSALHCVWVDVNSKLCYSSLPQGSDTWQPQQAVGLDGVAENAVNAASLAVFNRTIHAVFPDENNSLIHYQLSTGPNPVWGRRVGLSATTRDPPSITEFKGALYCIFRKQNAASNANLCMTWYSETRGWRKPVDVQGLVASFGPVALFELNDLLQLLVVDDTDTIRCYSYSISNGNWTPVHLPTGTPIGTPTGLVAASGISAHCVYNLAFISCRIATAISTIRLANHHWNQPQTIRVSTGTTPTIAIVGNMVYCVWSDGGTAEIKWMSRDALEIPQLNRWMSSLDDGLPISALTVPGAHDAAAVSVVPFVACQTMSITRQLHAGIRYFDLRAGFERTIFSTPQLVAYHGPWEIGTPILSIFREFYTFLADNTQKFECVVLQIKQDRQADEPDAARNFAAAIQSLITQAASLWRVDHTNPKLRDLRGKIQLVRRFPLPAGLTQYGIDVFQGWLDNPTSIVHLQNTDININLQDHWSLQASNFIDEKFGIVSVQLINASSDPNMEVWFINFCSGVVVLDTESYWVAIGDQDAGQGVNKRLANFFNNTAGSMRYGFILLDYAEDPTELLLAMVRSNFPGATRSSSS